MNKVKVFSVASDSDPKKKYKVEILGNYDGRCSCPSYTYRLTECKHIKLIKNSLGLNATKLNAHREKKEATWLKQNQQTRLETVKK